MEVVGVTGATYTSKALVKKRAGGLDYYKGTSKSINISSEGLTIIPQDVPSGPFVSLAGPAAVVALRFGRTRHCLYSKPASVSSRKLPCFQSKQLCFQPKQPAARHRRRARWLLLTSVQALLPSPYALWPTGSSQGVGRETAIVLFLPLWPGFACCLGNKALSLQYELNYTSKIKM
jgi:hypothetical protein